MSDTVEHRCQALAHFFQHHVKFDLYMGLVVEEVRLGYCRTLLPFRDEFIGDPWRPALHGGVAGFLADVTAGIAAMSTAPLGSRCGTIDLRIDYLEPAGPHDIIAEGHVLKAGRKIVTAEASLRQNGLLIAKATGAFRMKPQYADEKGLPQVP